MGLLLSGHSDGRLLTVHHRLEASDRHDIRLVHRGGPAAVDLTGMTDVPWEHRTRLLSDNGPGYISHSFGEYLRLVGIRHILASPFHPQTNGKLERYHRTIKLDVNQIPYDVPGNLEEAITDFVNYYNNRR
ncbi:MAG TPA: transposase [Dehalococcoidia bacterium]|nr:transposase [Dehalococcoidia bacterium]